MLDPIALAVPFFFLLMGGELVWARARRTRVYRFTDAMTALSCGMTSQVVLLAWAAAQIGIYAWLYRVARVVTLPSGWMPWLIAFVGIDFLYYWWHRLSHKVNVLWAAHVVHHQSEDFNLAVALRQSVLTSWTALVFYLPLAIVGVPTTIFVIVHALSMLYQFWIHTELIGRVRGPLDWIFNLPSHHRVHHAVNPQYLDKNYGATLIVWDRLFGTYAPEHERPIYGLTTPLASFDPMWAQVHYWFELAAMTRAARGFREKARVWIASPAWKPEAYVAAGAKAPLGSRVKYERVLSPRVARYVGVQFVLVVVATFVLMMWHHQIRALPLFLAGAAVLGGVFALGAFIEGRRWAAGVEAARLVLGCVAFALWLRS